MQKDASPAAVRTGCPGCPRVFGTLRCGISLYPVRLIISVFFLFYSFLQLIDGVFDWLLTFRLTMYQWSISVYYFSRKSWHHDLLFRSAVLSTTVCAEGVASVRHIISMYRSSLYNQMGNNTGSNRHDDPTFYECISSVEHKMLHFRCNNDGDWDCHSASFCIPQKKKMSWQGWNIANMGKLRQDLMIYSIFCAFFFYPGEQHL